MLETTPEHYKKYLLYYSTYPYPYGYVGEPPMKPGFFVIGVFTDPQLMVPPDIGTITDPSQLLKAIHPVTDDQYLIVRTAISDEYRESESQDVTVLPFLDGDASTIACLTTPKQLVPGPIKTKEIFLKALETNTGVIWFGYRPNVAVNDGWSLPAGAAVVLTISDLSRIYFLSTIAGDRLVFLYNV